MSIIATATATAAAANVEEYIDLDSDAILSGSSYYRAAGLLPRAMYLVRVLDAPDAVSNANSTIALNGREFPRFIEAHDAMMGTMPNFKLTHTSQSQRLALKQLLFADLQHAMDIAQKQIMAPKRFAGATLPREPAACLPYVGALIADAEVRIKSLKTRLADLKKAHAKLYEMTLNEYATLRLQMNVDEFTAMPRLTVHEEEEQEQEERAAKRIKTEDNDDEPTARACACACADA